MGTLLHILWVLIRAVSMMINWSVRLHKDKNRVRPKDSKTQVQVTVKIVCDRGCWLSNPMGAVPAARTNTHFNSKTLTKSYEPSLSSCQPSLLYVNSEQTPSNGLGNHKSRLATDLNIQRRHAGRPFSPRLCRFFFPSDPSSVASIVVVAAAVERWTVHLRIHFARPGCDFGSPDDGTRICDSLRYDCIDPPRLVTVSIQTRTRG